MSNVAKLKQPDVVEFAWPKGQREDWFPVEPNEDCIFIEQVLEEKTQSGLIIANTEHAKMPKGRVVAVGPGKIYYAPFNAGETFCAAVFVPTKFKVGDYVTWGRYRTGGEPWDIGGRRVVAAREGDLGGKLINPDADIRLVPQA